MLKPADNPKSLAILAPVTVSVITVFKSESSVVQGVIPDHALTVVHSGCAPYRLGRRGGLPYVKSKQVDHFLSMLKH